MKQRDENLSDEDRRIIRRRLVPILLLGPLTIFLPRVIGPVVSPQPYIDTWQRIAAGILMPWGWLWLVWTTLPYFVIGFAGLTFLQHAHDQRRALHRRWALMASLAAVFAVGAIIHVPQTVPGVNLGVAFFPVYAVPFAMLGYGTGYLAAWCAYGPVESTAQS